MASMYFHETPQGIETPLGVSVAQAVQELEKAGANIIGSNCGIGMKSMIPVARMLRKYSNLPVIIQPNAGIPEIVNGKAVYPESPEFMAENCRELLEAGVSIIGGCCGTTPSHIRAIDRAVHA
jgi:5-methyltetrahydrofolate--homocysteine methyltransferase